MHDERNGVMRVIKKVNRHEMEEDRVPIEIDKKRRMRHIISQCKGS